MKKNIIYISLTCTILSVFIGCQSVIASKSSSEILNKQVLAALFRNMDVKLSNAAYCEGVGVKSTDQTVGDYLSGFWAFHAESTGKSWLEISTIPNNKGDLARVMIYRKDGEENWGWGVSFQIETNGKVDRKSFTCLGGG